MLKSEAYKTLGLSENASKEDAKKAFKKIAAKLHPDVNKEPGSDEKFKKANEAYSAINSDSFDDNKHNFSNSGFNPFGGGFPGFGGFGFNPFGNRQHRQSRMRHENPIELHTNISFKDSVLGKKEDFSFQRKVKCEDCEGIGFRAKHNGCKECDGSGTITRQQGNAIYQSQCNSCRGKSEEESCTECSSKGFLEVNTSISVNIPGGILDGMTLRLSNMGNYMGSQSGFPGMSMDSYTDAYVRVSVEKSEGLEIDQESGNVVHTLNLHLIDALKGASIFVPTIHGQKEIKIPEKSRNKDQIILPKLGVNGQMDQVVTLDITYPSDVTKLISALEG
jgi:molecular chaperone DnaJ